MVAQVTAKLPANFGHTGFDSPTGPAGYGGISAGQSDSWTAYQPTCFHAGGVAATLAAFGNDSTPVNTETYLIEVFVPMSTTLTGIAILNGSVASGNVTVGLADATGAPIAAAVSASTSISGTNAYQQVPFATPYLAEGPAKYFVQVQFDTNTTPRYRTHIVGNFLAGKQTSQTYGTLTSFTPPTGFTTLIAPVCDTY